MVQKINRESLSIGYSKEWIEIESSEKINDYSLDVLREICHRDVEVY